jgi:hypothetical protein
VGETAHSEFKSRLEAVIRRVDAWTYADSDAGAGVPVELAAELRSLADAAPDRMVRQRLIRAQEALDDGLSSESVAAELYRIRTQLAG